MNSTKNILDTRKNTLNIKKAELSRKIIFQASIVASLNVLFFNNYAISLAIVVIELLILAYYFIKKDITKYIGSYLMFLCLSFEFDVLVGTEQFYGFKNFRILGINLGIITLLPVLGLAIFRGIKIKKMKEDFPSLYKFVATIIFLNITGLIFGLLQILTNDNNIQNMEGMFKDFIGISYSMVVIPFLMIVAIAYLISWERDKLEQLSSYLIAILVGVVASMIVSLASGNFGWYGGVKTLLVSNLILYVPFMTLVPFYEEYKSNKKLIIIGIIGMILSLTYNATGKMIIVCALIPIGIYGVLLKRKKILPIVCITILIPIILVFSIQVVERKISKSPLFQSKLNQVLSLVRFWEPNWLLNMPLSPRTRIVEFLSIVYEYCEKPWYFLFGKGYMGTFLDHTGLLEREFVPSAFSVNQWNNGTFYGVHGTIKLLFLYNGLFGLLFYLKMIKQVFANYAKNPWILIGGFWFLLFYGYSITISTYGITALLIGYTKLKRNDFYK